jgi:hypothetical protein
MLSWASLTPASELTAKSTKKMSRLGLTKINLMTENGGRVSSEGKWWTASSWTSSTEPDAQKSSNAPPKAKTIHPTNSIGRKETPRKRCKKTKEKRKQRMLKYHQKLADAPGVSSSEPRTHRQGGLYRVPKGESSVGVSEGKKTEAEADESWA